MVPPSCPQNTIVSAIHVGGVIQEQKHQWENITVCIPRQGISLVPQMSFLWYGSGVTEEEQKSWATDKTIFFIQRWSLVKISALPVGEFLLQFSKKKKKVDNTGVCSFLHAALHFPSSPLKRAIYSLRASNLIFFNNQITSKIKCDRSIFNPFKDPPILPSTVAFLYHFLPCALALTPMSPKGFIYVN